MPPPGDLPDPGIKPVSLMSPALAGGFFTTSATWEALIRLHLPAKLTADVRSTKQVGRGPSFHVTWSVRLFRGAIVVSKHSTIPKDETQPQQSMLDS